MDEDAIDQATCDKLVAFGVRRRELVKRARARARQLGAALDELLGDLGPAEPNPLDVLNGVLRALGSKLRAAPLSFSLEHDDLARRLRVDVHASAVAQLRSIRNGVAEIEQLHVARDSLVAAQDHVDGMCLDGPFLTRREAAALLRCDAEALKQRRKRRRRRRGT